MVPRAPREVPALAPLRSGQRIETRLYEIFEGLVRAKYGRGPDKARLLGAVNLDLEILRMLSRLAHEMKMLPHKSQAYAARETDDIGRMVGGWFKQQQQQGRRASSTG